MSNMQGGGKKNRSAIDNIVMISAITGQQRQGDKNTDLLLADAEKCFDKLRQKDFLIEIEDEQKVRNIKIRIYLSLRKFTKLIREK